MEALVTPIMLDYFTQRTLTGKSGLEPQWWPEMVAKELLDNGIDAAESAGVAPDVKLIIRPDFIAVEDNGGGITPEVLASAFDYSVRASGRKLLGSRKAWECRRVELNEIPPQQFAQWLERKIRDHGMDTKLVPPDHVVHDRVVETYQEKLRQRVGRYIESQLDVDAMVERAVDRIPGADASRVVAGMTKWAKATPETRWTQYVDNAIEEQLNRRRKTIVRAADAAMEGEL